MCGSFSLDCPALAEMSGLSCCCSIPKVAITGVMNLQSVVLTGCFADVTNLDNIGTCEMGVVM